MIKKIFAKKNQSQLSMQDQQYDHSSLYDYQEMTTTVKDLIAPSGISIGSDCLMVGSKYARTIFITVYPRFMDSSWLNSFINMDQELDISLHIHPASTPTVLKNLRKKVAQVESQISMNAQKGLPRDPMLETAISDIESLRDALQQGTEKFFRFGLYLTVYAFSKKELNERVKKIENMLESSLIYAKPAHFMVSTAFSSTLPLGQDKLFINTNMNTSPLSTSFPFLSSDLNHDRGILYGINRHNNSLVLLDRFSLPNSNSVVFATSGSGKSYAVKLEVLRSLMTGTEAIIIDPEEEYKELCDSVDGSYINISMTSKHHINPFDLITSNSYSGAEESDANVLRSAIVNLTGLLRLMLGGLTPEEEAIMDEALRETYALKDITPETGFKGKEMPTLSDFQMVLSGMVGGDSLSIRVKRFVNGAFAGFLNNPSNIDVNNKLVVFNIRDMEEELRPIAMYLVLNYIWNVVRADLKKRLLIVDEAWIMMKYESAGRFMHDIVKRARKYYLGVTTITQDVTDFLASQYGQPIVTNSYMQLLLKQSPTAIDTVAHAFNLTQQEKMLLLESSVGEGILFAGLNHVAIKVVASYYEDELITTNPEQILEMRRVKSMNYLESGMDDDFMLESGERNLMLEAPDGQPNSRRYATNMSNNYWGL